VGKSIYEKKAAFPLRLRWGVNVSRGREKSSNLLQLEKRGGGTENITERKRTSPTPKGKGKTSRSVRERRQREGRIQTLLIKGEKHPFRSVRGG